MTSPSSLRAGRARDASPGASAFPWRRGGWCWTRATSPRSNRWVPLCCGCCARSTAECGTVVSCADLGLASSGPLRNHPLLDSRRAEERSSGTPSGTGAPGAQGAPARAARRLHPNPLRAAPSVAGSEWLHGCYPAGETPLRATVCLVRSEAPRGAGRAPTCHTHRGAHASCGEADHPDGRAGPGHRGRDGARKHRQTPTVSVGGVVYSQFVYMLKDTANHNNNFDVTRAYVNVTGKLGPGIASRVTVDVYRVRQTTPSRSDSSTPTSPTPRRTARSPSSSARFTRPGWTGRKTCGTTGCRAPSCSTGTSTSPPLTSVPGWTATSTSDRFSFQAGVYNGEGYSGGTGDQRKDFEARASFRLMPTDMGGRSGGLRLTGYAGYGKPTGGGERQRFVGMLSYRSKMITLAGEFAATKDSSTTTPAAKRMGRVIAGFGVLKHSEHQLRHHRPGGSGGSQHRQRRHQRPHDPNHRRRVLQGLAEPPASGRPR